MPPIDNFKYYSGNLISAPATDGFEITPSDTVDFSQVTRAIYTGTGGSISVVMRDGATLPFTSVPPGVALPVRANRVNATGTDATGLLGLV